MFLVNTIVNTHPCSLLLHPTDVGNAWRPVSSLWSDSPLLCRDACRDARPSCLRHCVLPHLVFPFRNTALRARRIHVPFVLTYEVFNVRRTFLFCFEDTNHKYYAGTIQYLYVAMSPDLGFAGNILVFLVCVCDWFNGIVVPYSQTQTFRRLLALLHQPIHVPLRRHGQGCHPGPSRHLRRPGSVYILAAARPDLRFVCFGLGNIRCGTAAESYGDGKLQRLPMD
ncbi:hypothetical protein GJ744_003333 [Endocarpon pusillum]|uniref:Uncharacterized protein n=1 Tax=Endocarpon pusillum TaxID=364733 RepID=A0A8H7A7V0_9EURO|nr:hypothetical protein GJ744_003333 [Endocarpon pusillum]